MATATQFGSVTGTALAEYFVKRFNLVGRDAEYSKSRWTLSHMPRDTERLKQGDGFYETVKVGRGYSSSTDFVLGNTYSIPSKRMRWAVTDPYAQYGFVTFDNLTLQRNNLGTLLDLKASEAEDIKEGMLNDCEYDLWNNGEGVLGRVATLGGTEATRILTLETASDVFNFEYGMVIYGDSADTAAGSSASTENTDRYKVTDLDPIGGKVTCVQLTDTGSEAMEANDYLYVVGSQGNRMPGIPQFIPSTAPSDTLLGVTRTANPATSGWRFTFKASIAETIARAFSMMGRWVNQAAGKFVVCLSTMDWLLLSMEREGRAAPTDPRGVEKWGLETLAVRTSFGTIHCVAVPQLADGRGYIIDFTSWKLYTLRNLPHVVDEDGQMFVRGGVGTVSGSENVNGDFIKMQFRLWKILLCLKPMSNATFPTRAS
jgi:hypothetical protein